MEIILITPLHDLTCKRSSGPEVKKLFLCSTEHEILTADKSEIPTNEEVSCWHFNIYEQNKFRAQLS